MTCVLSHTLLTDGTREGAGAANDSEGFFSAASEERRCRDSQIDTLRS